MVATRVWAAVLFAVAVLTAVSGVPGAPDRVVGQAGAGRAALGAAARERLVTPVTAAAACKPSGPVRVDLVPEVADDGTLALDVTIEPLSDFTELAWSTSCRGGVAQLDGPHDGVVALRAFDLADAAPAPRTSDRVRLAVAPDVPAAWTLRVEGRLPGGEPIVVRRTVVWGDEQLVAPGGFGEAPSIPSGRTPSVTTLPTRTGR